MLHHDRGEISELSPQVALDYLREGNFRFVNNLKSNRNVLQQVNETRVGQFPFAAVFSCIDSRMSSELIFDQGLGDVFSIRIAGAVINPDILGSLEFACKIAGSKLIVVLGHTKCGAIQGACDDVQIGNLSTLLNKIQPAVFHEKSVKDERNSSNSEFVEKVMHIQVRRSVEGIVEQSRVLREMVESKDVGVIGAVYDVDSGEVEFLDDTFLSGEIW